MFRLFKRKPEPETKRPFPTPEQWDERIRKHLELFKGVLLAEAESMDAVKRRRICRETRWDKTRSDEDLKALLSLDMEVRDLIHIECDLKRELEDFRVGRVGRWCERHRTEHSDPNGSPARLCTTCGFIETNP